MDPESLTIEPNIEMELKFDDMMMMNDNQSSSPCVQFSDHQKTVLCCVYVKDFKCGKEPFRKHSDH